jgi:Zn-finger nucleic acid-binding protein
MPAGGFYKQPVKTGEEGGAGSPRSCPVCGVLLDRGELVKSSVFPDPGNGTGRLMYIKGCVFCLSGRRPGKRKCPVCGAPLDTDEILFARMFNNSKRSHVHVLGCSRCRGPGKS